MDVLGFDDDTWFGLQNSQQNTIINSMNQVYFYNDNNINSNNINNNDQLFPSSSSSSSRYEAFCQPNLDVQLELQRQEIDYILHFQNEKMRIAFQEQRKQHISLMMRCLESKATTLIQQKEDDLARATRKGIELQERLRRVDNERHSWQRIAIAKEASAIELNNALQQALIVGNDNKAYQNDNNREDAESTCFVGNSYEDFININNNKKWVCRVCKYRSSCVVLLPCKHLCSCKLCEAFLGSCPVCESVKETSFEVFLV